MLFHKKIIILFFVFFTISCATLFPSKMSLPSDNMTQDKVSQINNVSVKVIPIDSVGVVKNMRPDYKIKHYDSLYISVAGHPEISGAVTTFNPDILNNSSAGIMSFALGRALIGGATSPNAGMIETYFVDNKGYIDFPLIGSVKLYDLTLNQAKNKIKKLLTPYIINPQVKIIPAASKNRYINVVGEIKQPLVLPLSYEGTTLAEAITLAGGPLDGAKFQEIYVLRKGNDVNSVLAYNLDASNAISMVYAQEFFLQSDDVVYVSRHSFTQFTYIMQQLLPATEALWYSRDLGNPNQWYPFFTK